MIRISKLGLIIGVSLFLTSCAFFAKSMKPDQVDSTLPGFSVAKYMSAAQAEELVRENKGKYLVRGRLYIAPMSYTVKHELKLGARGIDEWVKQDGGNAYALVNYKWVKIDDSSGKTQLYLEFDTMLCE